MLLARRVSKTLDSFSCQDFRIASARIGESAQLRLSTGVKIDFQVGILQE
jgi:hypothetical protein